MPCAARRYDVVALFFLLTLAAGVSTRTPAASCSPEGAWVHMGTLSAPEPRTGASMVWTGSELIVWGGSTTAGIIQGLSSGARYDPGTDSWRPTSLAGAPEARAGHAAVWTGSRMIVWGGYVPGASSPGTLGTGASYDPSTDSWAPLSTVDAPSPRKSFRAVWTGTRMLVWGGYGTTSLDTGAIYDPGTDTWTPMPATGAPSARYDHSAVWTGDRMIIWGGSSGTADGAMFDPAANSWQPVATAGAPQARTQHGAAWAAGRMIVWGGYSGGSYLNTGGVYDPAAGSWSPTTQAGAPAGGRNVIVADAGEKVMVWGGENSLNGAWQDSGALYDPDLDEWTPLPAFSVSGIAAPAGDSVFIWGGSAGGRYVVTEGRWRSMRISPIPAPGSSAGVWTGSEMIVWPAAGSDGGHRYDPAQDSWRSISGVGAPVRREGHTAVWTGTRMIVWGGAAGCSLMNTGGVYDPLTDTWTPTSLVGAPSPRQGHTAVWTGTRMIIWGGRPITCVADDLSVLGDGAMYDPQTDTWAPIPAAAGVSPRTWHTAVWTGSEMIVWGGADGFYEPDYIHPLGGGARFNPTTGAWTSLPSTGAPSARFMHSAVWAGTQMIIWGGTACVCVGCGPCPTADSGGRYRPSTNAWTPVGTAGDVPAGFSRHLAVWTGNRMIVYAGPGRGSQYRPALDDWVRVSADDAPAAWGTAFWTGRAMLVWGTANPGGLFFPDTLADADGDGYAICDGDCHDGISSVNPGGIEVCNGLDDDCSGLPDEAGASLCADDGDPCTADLCGGALGCTHGDVDADGRLDALCGGSDCDDAVGTVWAPPEEAVCGDMDTSRYPNILRCEPQDAAAGPGTRFDMASGVLYATGLPDFPAGSCRYTGTMPLFYDATTAPAVGTARWYLVRARNGCGASTWGSEAADTSLPPCE